jgi:hypothetical protein
MDFVIIKSFRQLERSQCTAIPCSLLKVALGFDFVSFARFCGQKEDWEVSLIVKKEYVFPFPLPYCILSLWISFTLVTAFAPKEL